MQLVWNKCVGEAWCKLSNVNLSHAHFDNMDGVYIIWHGGPNAATVRVGQGNIRERLTAHRNDPEVQKFESLALYVTWAKVQSTERDGVEIFLAQKLSPKVGDRFPNKTPTQVNLPW